MRLANKILFASLNHEKFEEFQALLKGYPEIELLFGGSTIRNAEGLRFVESHSTYLENAIAKARLANQAAHYPALGDDSGIEVEALNGRPGPRSHRYATPRSGISQDQANRELLLKEMESAQNRSARFVCCLALAIEGILLHSTGTIEGTLTEKTKGIQGFGYDSIFIPKGETRTLAEMCLQEKNAISHRSQALHDLMTQVKSHGIALVKP